MSITSGHTGSATPGVVVKQSAPPNDPPHAFISPCGQHAGRTMPMTTMSPHIFVPHWMVVPPASAPLSAVPPALPALPPLPELPPVLPALPPLPALPALPPLPVVPPLPPLPAVVMVSLSSPQPATLPSARKAEQARNHPIDRFIVGDVFLGDDASAPHRQGFGGALLAVARRTSKGKRRS